jgi:hypothetical protein
MLCAVSKPRKDERKKIHRRHRLTTHSTIESTTLTTTEVASGK